MPDPRRTAPWRPETRPRAAWDALATRLVVTSRPRQTAGSPGHRERAAQRQRAARCGRAARHQPNCPQHPATGRTNARSAPGRRYASPIPHAGGEIVSRHFEDIIRLNSQRLADLKKTTAELERELSDARVLAGTGAERRSRPTRRTRLPEEAPEARRYDPYEDYLQATNSAMFAGYAAPESAPDYGSFIPDAPAPEYGRYIPDDLALSPEQRTEVLISHGRHSAYRRGLSGRSRISMAVAGLAAFITILVIVVSSGGASWPASVAMVRSEIDRACRRTLTCGRSRARSTSPALRAPGRSCGCSRC